MLGNKRQYLIEYLAEVAAKDIPKLDYKVKNIIKRKIEKLTSEPYLGIPLRERLAGCYKLKVSKYRIIYKIYNDRLIVLVIAIGKRDDLEAYKIAEKRNF